MDITLHYEICRPVGRHDMLLSRQHHDSLHSSVVYINIDSTPFDFLPFMGTLKPQSSGPLYTKTVVGNTGR